MKVAEKIWVAICLLLNFCHGGPVKSRGAIYIDSRPGDTFQVHFAGDVLELVCEATFPVKWSWPDNSAYEGYNDLSKRVTIENLTGAEEQGDIWYTSKLLLDKLQYADTGKYFCRAAVGDKKASVYIFAHDSEPNHIFLHPKNSESVVGLSKSQESIVPCRSTHYDVNAELLIDNNKVKNGNVQFDPEQGFLIPSSFFATYSSGTDVQLKCKANVDAYLISDSLTFNGRIG